MDYQDEMARGSRGREWSSDSNSANKNRQYSSGMLGQLGWLLRAGWSLALRNRVAIGLASLAWLIYRSGTKPSRLAYPCQQAAVANVTVILAGLIPACLLSRLSARGKGAEGLRGIGLWKRQTVVAGLLFVTAFLGVEGFQYAGDVSGGGTVYETSSIDLGTSLVGIARQAPAGSWYSDAEIEALVRRAVAQAGGLEPIMVDKNGDGHIKVFIKPNVTQDKWQPGEGVNTHPTVVRTLVLMAQEAGADEVVIAEGVAASRDMDFHGRGITYEAFRTCGYDSNNDQLDDVTGVQLLDLNDCGTGNVIPLSSLDPQNPPPDCSAVEITDGALRSVWWQHNTLVEGHPDEVDVLINASALKNHGQGGVTMALKNRVGTAPNDVYYGGNAGMTGPYAVQLKWSGVHSVVSGFPHDFGSEPQSEDECVQRAIVDLNLARPNDFAVVDGLVGIENGPIGDGYSASLEQRSSELIIAGRDSVAVDTVGTIAMGYTPYSIPQLINAHNTGRLGTMDTAQITVQGDRISLVRDNYRTGWDKPGEQVRGEENPPWLTTISVDEGDMVVGGQALSGSGIGDDVGVVKAEVAVDKLGSNLVVNGGFENGSTGWSEWENASWGANKVRDYANQEAGRVGDYCLKLGSASSFGSYGVYQEVSVEPGKTYRLDVYWRGQKLTDMNWFEVLLLDGPFDLMQADTGNPASEYVEPNYVYAYDNNTYGLPGPIGTTFGWVWGHEQYSGPNPLNQVDWNNRQGRRTASGSTMTVVLKAGSLSAGIACWFDEVSLREVEGEEVVATLAGPGDPFSIVVPGENLKPGVYDAELRMSVYDAMLNEDSIYRNVVINSTPPDPLICANRQSITRSVFVGDPLDDGTLDVWNCGNQEVLLDYTLTVDPVEARDWLEVVPDFGSSGISPNTHTLVYTVEGLKPGTYAATIVIEGNATNSPLEVGVNLTVETVLVDFDGDGDVDMDDYGFMQQCLSHAPGAAPPAGCEGAMLDDDEDVDAADILLFKECLSGANVVPDRTCDDNFH